MALKGTYDPDNVFAKILRGDMPCVKIYEDEDVLSFMDVFPQSRGHTLVIPKTASRNLLDTKPDVIAVVAQHTQKIAHAIDKALSPDGIVISQFNGAPAGQTVFHLHVHIIPRYNDISPADHASGHMADMDELSALAVKIKDAL